MTFTHRVPLRWSDFDGLGHVSHTAMLVLLEAGRDPALAAHGISSADYVVAHCEVTYRAEIAAGTTEVDVECAVNGMGRTSITTDERIVSGGTTVVEARFTLVLWDGVRRRARPISDAERASLVADSYARTAGEKEQS